MGVVTYDACSVCRRTAPLDPVAAMRGEGVCRGCATKCYQSRALSKRRGAGIPECVSCGEPVTPYDMIAFTFSSRPATPERCSGCEAKRLAVPRGALTLCEPSMDGALTLVPEHPYPSAPANRIVK